jgi:hypothetical protein
MATCTQIGVTAADNELYLIAAGPAGTSEICHIKSGPGHPVNFTFAPQSVLHSGVYDLIVVGIKWGGPQALEVTLSFSDGCQRTLNAPPGTAVGANWTEVVPGLSV